jgi:hypothetical protein
MDGSRQPVDLAAVARAFLRTFFAATHREKRMSV